MEAPFSSLVDSAYVWVGIAAVVALATGWVQARIAGQHLETAVTNQPIIDLEMAGTKERFDEIVASWDAPRKGKAKQTLAWDVPFLVAYGFGLALLCAVGAEAFRGFGWPCVGSVVALVAWGALVATLLDAVENMFLYWGLVSGVPDDTRPRAVRWLAKTKFLLALKIAVPVAFVSLGFDLLGCRFFCER